MAVRSAGGRQARGAGRFHRGLGALRAVQPGRRAAHRGPGRPGPGQRAAGAGRLRHPGADPVGQRGLAGGLGVPVPGLQPQLLGVVRGLEDLLGVVDREIPVLVPVHDQQRDARDPGRGLIRGHRHRVPGLGGDPGVRGQPGDQAAQAVLDREVDPPHPLGAPEVPPAGAADRGHRVQAAADQTGVTQHDRGAHGEPDRGDALVAELTGVADDHVEVVDLLVAQGGRSPGPPVPAEVEAEYASQLVEPGRDLPDRGPLPGQGEPVGQHDGQVAVLGQMHRVDRDAIASHQGVRHCHECSHTSHCAAGIAGRVTGPALPPSPACRGGRPTPAPAWGSSWSAGAVVGPGARGATRHLVVVPLLGGPLVAVVGDHRAVRVGLVRHPGRGAAARAAAGGR